jgi:hypothetical protein
MAVEIIYPIKPDGRTNRLVHKLDTGYVTVVQKTQTLVRKEKDTIQFRIRRDNFDAFYGFLVDNYGINVTLNIPGIQPFIRAGASHTVKIIDFSPPMCENPLHYRMSVTFEWVS